MRWREIPLSAWIGIAGLTLAIVCAIFAPWIAPYGEREVVGDIWLPMGGQFLLGTDNLGRDLLSRLIYGAQTTISVALAATAVPHQVDERGARVRLLRPGARCAHGARREGRSEEHTSELQSLMRISYAVYCLKKNNKIKLSTIPRR